MRTYTRARIPGSMYFFTVNLASRGGNTLLVDRVSELREAFLATRRDHPFEVVAIVVLPDHLHCLWCLPQDDANFPMRWRLIKARFSGSLPVVELVSDSRKRKGERGVWQRRYWEHVIRDEADYHRHADYIHFNPVKHGYVSAVKDWPHSSFHRHVQGGQYPLDWGGTTEILNENWE
jgi:putative transposase